MNNTPPIPPREGLDLPPVSHEVLRTPVNVEQNQIPEQPVPMAPQSEIVQQDPNQPQATEETGNHDTSQSAPGLVFAQGPQDPEQVIESIVDGHKPNKIHEAQGLVERVNQVQSEETGDK